VYPSVKASGYVTPSLERKWRVPTKPIGNTWYIPLPMSVSDVRMARGVLAYVMEYLTSAMLEEKFRVDEKPRPVEREVAGRRAIGISLKVRLPPYDAAILEDVQVLAMETADGRISFGVHATLLTGKRYVWVSSHKNFVDEVRKQLLMWKSLREEDAKRYLRLGRELFKGLSEGGE
ncbi:MAG: hypothetical protein DRJ56_03090, partial [Thermoprotei archaeon]